MQEEGIEKLALILRSKGEETYPDKCIQSHLKENRGRQPTVWHLNTKNDDTLLIFAKASNRVLLKNSPIPARVNEE